METIWRKFLNASSSGMRVKTIYLNDRDENATAGQLLQSDSILRPFQLVGLY